MRGAVSVADAPTAPPTAAPGVGDGPRGDAGLLDAARRLPAARSWAPWCDTREPALRDRLRRRLGPEARLTLRGPGEAVEAPLLLCTPARASRPSGGARPRAPGAAWS